MAPHHQQPETNNSARDALSGHSAIQRMADDMRRIGEGATDTDMLRFGWSRRQLDRYGQDASKTAARLSRRLAN